MHMHLVQFQLVSRQDFDMDAYMEKYMDSFQTGVNYGMTGMYMGAEGPPLLYDEKNEDGAIGGNPAVSTFLLNNPIPPAANERGWKDVIKAYPNQVTTYIVRFAPTDKPNGTSKPLLRYTFDPSKGPGYVWHCHIVEHEDNDMMRPMNVQPNSSSLASLSAAIKANPYPAEGVVLEQNFPNPFSGETEIRFTLPEPAHVQLSLFSSVGSEVKTILDADAPGGLNTARLNAGNLKPGIYFYQLRTGGVSQVKRMVVQN